MIAMSDADKEKLSNYERIVEIVKDQMALQRHIEEKRYSFASIQFSQADAYLHIVEIVAGPKKRHAA